MTKARVIKQSPYIVVVRTMTAGVQFVKEIEDNGVVRYEFCLLPHSATRYATKKEALAVCKLIPAINYPEPDTIDESLTFNDVIARTAKGSNACH